MVLDGSAEISGLKCWGGTCIFFGILALPDLALALPALITGCAITCAGDSVVEVKRQVGCAKCCSITGIVFAVLTVILAVIIGVLLSTTWYGLCEIAQNYWQTCGSGSSRRALSSVPATAAHGMVQKRIGVPGFALEKDLSELLAGLLVYALPPLYRRDENGGRVQIDLLPSGRQLSSDSDSCRHSFDGECDDGGLGSEYDRCPQGTDMADCGPRGPIANTDTCLTSSDGDCDDGGPGSEYSSCTFGDDCNDCGCDRGRAGGWDREELLRKIDLFVQ